MNMMLLLVGLLLAPPCQHWRHHQQGVAQAFSLNVAIPSGRTSTGSRKANVLLRQQHSSRYAVSAQTSAFNNDNSDQLETSEATIPLQQLTASTCHPTATTTAISTASPSLQPPSPQQRQLQGHSVDLAIGRKILGGAMKVFRGHKALKPALVALGWYVTSSALAVAAEAATRIPGSGKAVGRMNPNYHKQHSMALRFGTIMCLYYLSNKNIKKRNRFEGVVPRDAESREIIAADAHDQAMSYGRPAGRVALLGVDIISFSLAFFYMGNELRKASGIRSSATVPPWNPLFWNANTFFAMFSGLLLPTALRVMGHGYIRLALGVWLAPMARNFVVKPAKFVSSLWGFDVDWDVGPTPEERMRMNEGRMTSRELRESLSTFEDPTAELRGEDRDYYDDEVDEDMEDEADEDMDDEADDSFDEEGSQGDTDDTPPDLRRSS